MKVVLEVVNGKTGNPVSRKTYENYPNTIDAISVDLDMLLMRLWQLPKDASIRITPVWDDEENKDG